MRALSELVVEHFQCIMKALKVKQFGCSTKTQSKLCVVCIGYEEIHSDRSNIFYLKNETVL